RRHPVYGPLAMLPPDLPDSELVLRVRKGDGSAYRPLVERYQNRIHAMVYGMVRDPEEARDITQNAFIKAYQNLASFRIESSFYTWIYRIAMNLAIDHCRKNKRRKTSAFDEAVASRDEDGTIIELHQAESPQKALQRKQLHERIFAALDELSEDQREVVLLREVEGLSYKEIADTMGIPEGTVMSRLFYARKRLQALLGQSTGEM
ncbi:MAG: sigma-70 family RNA polymerase sigma factor, partial [Myxococcota bacterium]